MDVSNPPPAPDPNGLSWPQNNEVGRWLGCPTDSSGWYGPDGGGHAGMSAEEWTSKLEGNGWIHYAVPYDHLICDIIMARLFEHEHISPGKSDANLAAAFRNLFIFFTGFSSFSAFFFFFTVVLELTGS